MSGVKVKERYAPERRTLVRMAFFRIKDGEEVKNSSWLLCGSSGGFWLFFWGDQVKPVSASSQPEGQSVEGRELPTFVPGRNPRKGARLKDTRALTLRGKPWLSREGLRWGGEPAGPS